MARITPFGISALSKSNHKYAYMNEVMCNKDIGEMAVRTREGDTVSYNYFTRLTTSINLLTQVSAFYGINGMIYTLTIPDVDLPTVISDDTVYNFTCDKPAKKLIFAVDADAVKTEENVISHELIDNVRVSFTINGIEINHLIQDITSVVIELPERVESFTISDFKLYVDDAEITDYTLYLNNILCLIES